MEVLGRWTHSWSAEAGDVPALPWRLDGPSVVVRSDKGDRLARGHAVQHGEASERSTGSAAPTVAGDLHPLRLGSTPGLPQRVVRIVAIEGEPEVRPANPPGSPRGSGRSPAEQVEPELRQRSLTQRPAQRSSAHKSSRRQAQHSTHRRIPQVSHDLHGTSDDRSGPARTRIGLRLTWSPDRIAGIVHRNASPSLTPGRARRRSRARRAATAPDDRASYAWPSARSAAPLARSSPVRRRSPSRCGHGVACGGRAHLRSTVLLRHGGRADHRGDRRVAGAGRAAGVRPARAGRGLRDGDGDLPRPARGHRARAGGRSGAAGRALLPGRARAEPAQADRAGGSARRGRGDVMASVASGRARRLLTGGRGRHRLRAAGGAARRAAGQPPCPIGGAGDRARSAGGDRGGAGARADRARAA